MNAAQLQAYIRFLNTESQPGPLGDAYFGPNGGGPITGVECLNVRAFGAVGDGVTDDTAAITNAVATVNAVSANFQPLLCWPAGVYLTTASIPHFHSIYHGGPGIVQRGSDLFHISPNNTETNTIYAAISAGLSANDGLSASEPVATLQQGIDNLTHWGPYLVGTWAIQLTAETFARGRFPDLGLQSAVPIQVNGVDVGGHPNVPTTIVSEAANGTTGVGIYLQEHTRVQVSNVKFIGWNGTTSSAGFEASGSCEIFSVNCHFYNCAIGVYGLQWTLIDVKGGIFDTCGYNPSSVAYSTAACIFGLFHCKFSVGTQSADTLTLGPVLQNSTFGGYAQENTTGHFDWVTIANNSTGVRLNLSSRMNLDGCSFTNNGIACWTQESSVVSPSANTVYGTGGSANTINFTVNGGDIELADYMIKEVVGIATEDQCVKRVYAMQAVHSTSSTVLYTATLKAQVWVDGPSTPSAMKRIRIKIFGSLTGVAGTKLVQIRFGTGSAACDTTFAATEAGPFVAEGNVFIGTNPIGTQLCRMQGFSHNGLTSYARETTVTVDMTSDTVFTIEARVANAADTITISSFEVYFDGF